MGTIALITDFGTKDWFVGEMKGAMLRIAPGTTFIDISHDIPPGDIRAAAFTLLACYRTFPANTVFCVVVDPGVGSSRAMIAASGENCFFVAPDNGVLWWALNRETKREIRKIENEELVSPQKSNTFHGRDIFGPVAAHLSIPIAFDRVGPLYTSPLELPWPTVVIEKDRITGTIIHIDRFGNAITTIDKSALAHLKATPTRLTMMKFGTELPLHSYFKQVPTGEGLAYIGSTGFVEIAINNANASSIFGLHVEDQVVVS
jgi:S-adenosylmethionine hydrolase